MLPGKAAQRKLSLKSCAVAGRTQKADFSDLAGRWIADPAFDETIAAQRQIDWDKWK